MNRAGKIASASAFIAAAAVMVAAAGASTASNRTLAFATVNRGTVSWKFPTPAAGTAWAQIVNRVVEAPGQGEDVDFRKYFGVYAYVMRPTSGYAFTIRRILLQRLGGFRQLCVVASVPRPTGAVTQEKSMSAHYVKIKRGNLGFNLPDHIVLRQQRAGVLYATPGSRRAACKT
jgi:hypothetical protein